ncbi:hypothetical protein GCM10023332_10030 [Luteimonas vadosa]|uniref:DUF3857 domain-containing protein n=2 Tax=Luteimonas vadosa TaxID=1165507 RepID=A0ABP9DU18_9GAMM
MLVWLLAASLQASEVEHKRGDFRYFVAPEPAFVVRQPLPDAWDATAPGAKGAPWRFWLYDRQVDRRQGRDEAYVEYAYEASTASLLGDAGRYQIDFNPEYQRLTIHRVELRRNGAWEDRLLPDHISLARREGRFEEDLADGQVTALIVLDDIRVNDVVRFGYTIAGSNPVLEGQASDSMAFAWRNPLLDARLRVLHDPGTAIDVYRVKGVPEPVLRNSDTASEATIHAHGLPVVVYEDNYPVWFDPYPRAQVSAKRSWSDVVAWAMPLYPADDSLPADLEQRIAEWRKLPTPEARLTAALRAVQDEVRYFGVEMGQNTHRPVPPMDTWRRRRGDCKDKAYLLTTILARLGIAAAPALVSTDSGRLILDFKPSAYVFNHVIVRAELAGKPVWVDPTLSQQGGDPTRYDLSRYGAALPVRDGVVALETIAPPAGAIAGVEVAERYAHAPDGNGVRLDISTVYRGSSADHIRKSQASERRDEMARRYAEFYRKRFGELRMVEEPRISDDREANIIKVEESYLLAAPFEATSAATKALSVRADALDSLAALPPSLSRTGPLYFGTPGKYRQEVQFTIPDQWSPTFGKESKHLKAAAFDYRREAGVEGRNARIVHELEVKDYDIHAAGTASHLEEMRKVRDSLSATLRFRVPASLDDAERGKRLKDLLKSVLEEGDGG